MSERALKVLCVAGARPNFMKIAPILRAFKARAPRIEARLVHTGQHYDYEMNEAFFRQLEIPEPDISLEVGSASHAVQTAEIMKRFEPVLDRERPAAVLVVGDVNSTIACALVAAKKQVPVVHVEAGLRSRDRSMPEEINRILTDQLAERLYVTERDAIGNLLAEGKREDQIVFTGNVMIDTLNWALDRAVDPAVTLGNGFDVAAGYGLVTLHRPATVDDPSRLEAVLGALREISVRLPLVFPVHPRTRARIEEAGLADRLARPGIRALEPLGYFETIGLMRSAAVVLTDSGGMQEETSALGVPCLTLRDNTERPITIEQGTNELVGTDPAALTAAVGRVLNGGARRGRVPEFWDGQAAARIADDLEEWLGGVHAG